MTTDIQHMTTRQLKRYMSKGIIQVEINPYYKGKDMSEIKLEELEEFQRFKHLLGHGISQSEASRRYDIPQATISRWVKLDHIPRLGMDRNRVLIDEAYISYYAHKYKKLDPGQGRRNDNLLFDS